MDHPDHVHVVPINDLREHFMSMNCWCRPDEDDMVPGLFVHHSMDLREELETGERVPS